MSLAEYLDGRRRLIDRALDQYLPTERTCLPLVARAMRYSVFAGGKRLRPILTLAAADAVGGSREPAIPAACAVEMIHTYSLIHDDLPAMDNDSLRRGMATNHIVFGEATAILAGDALLTYAFEVMATHPPDDGSPETAARKLQAIRELSAAAGAGGMVGGQVADLQGTVDRADAALVEYIHAHKTGSLMSAAAAAGAILGGGSAVAVDCLRRYGAELGLAFQIIDDVLDVTGGKDLGKTAGKDEAAGKLTYPAVHGLDRSRACAAEHADRARSSLEPLGIATGPLIDLLRLVLDRES